MAGRDLADVRRRRATMRDVASTAGVSVQTVSNVVNGRLARVGPGTAERVQHVIADLGFVPNPVARGLRSSRTDTIAFLLLDPAPRWLADPMTDAFLAGLGSELREHGQSLLIRSDNPGVPLRTLAEPLVDGRVDGAVIALSGPPAQRRGYLHQLRALTEKPLLLLQEHGRTGLPVVAAQDRAGAAALCRHLIGQGHERIAFVTGGHEWSAIEARRRGYRDAHADAGLPVDESLLVRSGRFEALEAARTVLPLLERPDRPTAVMCGNDLLALGVVKAARDRGLAVPGDLAVTGFDDFEFANAVEPALTSVEIPAEAMGRYAAAALLAAERSAGAPESRVFETRLRLRESA